jgi:hypothetical protein
MELGYESTGRGAWMKVDPSKRDRLCSYYIGMYIETGFRRRQAIF